MKPEMRLGLTIGTAIVGATALWAYLSPYQTCVRALTARYKGGTLQPEIRCAAVVSGYRNSD